jgi:hypothetical protein
MNQFEYLEGVSSLVKNNTLVHSDTKPVFSFEYDSLFYNEYVGVSGFKLDGVKSDMTTSQIAEVESFIDSASVEADPLVLQNSVHCNYLASTDWYVVRQAETGKAIPADVLELRAAARLAVVN